MVASEVDVGHWGGNGGENPWRFKPADGKITEIRIRSGDCVDSIRFTYTDNDNVKHHSETYGGDGGSAKTITFADLESIIGISGTVGAYSDKQITVITSLSFETTKTSYGPYGTNGTTGFSLPVTSGKFVGFTGNYGDVLDSFGAILGPS